MDRDLPVLGLGVAEQLGVAPHAQVQNHDGDEPSRHGAGSSASPPVAGSKRPRSPPSRGESSGAARHALHLFSGPKQLPEGLAACLRARGWEVDEMDSGSVPGHSNDLLRNWSNGSEETTCLF